MVLFRRKPQDLPQHEETWHAFAFKMRSWIAERGQKPVRPDCLMILDLTTGLMMGAEITAALTLEWVKDMVFKAITRPGQGIEPHRPQTITFPEDSWVTALTQPLAEIGVTCAQMDTPQELYQIVADLESHMRGDEPDLPGLLSVEGVTPDVAGELFAAATEFYRAAPWIKLTNSQALAVQIPTHEVKYVSVMGNAGIEYGLSVSARWEDFRRMASGETDDIMQAIPESGGHSLLFNEPMHVAFDDLDAMERYHWPVPDENAIPVPMIFTRAGQVLRPDRQELIWYQAALRAIPIFAREHLQPDGHGDYVPVEASIPVPTSEGEVTVVIRYPAGEIDRALEPVVTVDWRDEHDEEEEMPFFDRRMMEGQMAAIARQVGGESLWADPKLRKAQDLMYQAWETQNPAKRLALAHKALSVSPDCADAYVLLAEEEADTVGRALELYQQGVAAGERALSKHWEELKGNFWSALETRPYMRAREGLAHTLWRLGRLDEALAHYQDMLRLNPNDNQGVRYSALNLLMTLDRDADALRLLNQYRGEWSAQWTYTRALLEFRKRGASVQADRALRSALRQNPHVPPYLLGQKRMPKDSPEYIGMGDEREAIAYAADHLNHWRRTEGALDWLQAQLAAQAAKATAKRAGEPSWSDLIEELVAQATGPISVDELVKQLLTRKSSQAKNPVKAVEAKVRDPYKRKSYVFLDRNTLIPIRLALQGVRFRIPLDRQMVSSGAVPLYPYFWPFLRDLRLYRGLQVTPIFENEQGYPIPAELIVEQVEAQGLFGEMTRVPTQAMDLKSWLSAVHARRGDSLLLTVLDWEQGHFQLMYEPERRRRKTEIESQNRALADLLYDLLEATHDEQLVAEHGLLTAYARLPSARGYPGDHWTTVLERDGRMRWDNWLIVHAESEHRSLFEMIAGEPGEDAVEEKPFTAQQGKQVYRFRASRGQKEFIIEAQGKNTLGDLDAMMKEAFRLDVWDHLSEFTLITPRGKGKRPRLKHFGALDPLGEYAAHSVRIAGLGLEPGAQLEYVYDFGDNIEHALVLEAVEEPEKGVEYPRFRRVSGKRK